MFFEITLTMQSRDLGLLGEAEFKRLCHNAGLTVHKSEMDRTGWDFLVEFPCKQDNRFPQDLLPPPLECKIQVKSTDKQRKRESIKLSNLSRLIKAQMPAFFCFFEFDGKETAQAIYLVHVGKEIIERTLKRIRELENKGGGNSLNKCVINIAYGEPNRLDDLTGSSLKSAIENMVPISMEKYIENKNRILKTAGFEDGKYQAKITVVSDDPIGDLLDVSLGLRKEINIHKIVGHHKRFGILSSNPNVDCDEGVITIQVNPIDARLKFKEHRFSTGISFIGKLYMSPFNRFIPEDRVKFRVETNFFDLIIESDKFHYLIRLCHNEKTCISELARFLEFLSMLEEKSRSITVELEAEGLKSSPILIFSSEDFPLPLLEVSIDGYQVSTWTSITKIAKMVIELCKKFHIPEEDLFVSIEDLLNLYQYLNFKVLYQAFCGNAESLILYFPDGDKYQQHAQAASVCFAKVSIGNYTIGCCLGIVGSLSLPGHQQELVGKRFLIGQQFITKIDDAIITKEEIKLGLNELVETLQMEEVVAIKVVEG